MNKADFYSTISENGYYTNAKRLKFYLENQLFRNIDFRGKTLIDIGGGSGLFGFYAAIQGASKVVIMEPEFEGSSTGMNEDFYGIKRALNNPENIELNKDILENFDRTQKFDYVLMHNSINHINEEACIHLKTDETAQKEYYNYFEQMREICHDESSLIICDCSRSNVFNSIGLNNPIAKTIEWEKHQGPHFWASMLENAGFKTENISWNSPNFLGNIGKLFFANSLMAYLTISHFRLEMSIKK